MESTSQFDLQAFVLSVMPYFLVRDTLLSGWPVLRPLHLARAPFICQHLRHQKAHELYHGLPSRVNVLLLGTFLIIIVLTITTIS